MLVVLNLVDCIRSSRGGGPVGGGRPRGLNSGAIRVQPEGKIIMKGTVEGDPNIAPMQCTATRARPPRAAAPWLGRGRGRSLSSTMAPISAREIRSKLRNQRAVQTPGWVLYSVKLCITRTCSQFKLCQKVRKTPSWPRSWASFSLLPLSAHKNA